MHQRQVICLRPDAARAALCLREIACEWQVVGAERPQVMTLEPFRVGLLLLTGAYAQPEGWPEYLERWPETEWIALLEPKALDHAGLRRLVFDYCRDYHTLPIEPGRLRAALGHAYGMSLLSRRAAPAAGAHGLVGSSPPMFRLADAIERVAAVAAPVLIHGESGTGKELVARAVHRTSPRAQGPFIAVNCGALPDGLVHSELFGHERGAFTGAAARKIGRIEAAHGGTIFLDEIGDLPLEQQVNLLRFLQEGVVERLGAAGATRAVSVRVVAATHVDLERAVADGRFRDDLYYRLNVLRLEMPPLRERPGDVGLLAEHWFARFKAEKAPGVRGFSRQARDAMARHAWPGNVRELINRVRRAMVMCEGRWISAADLGLEPAGERCTLGEIRAHAERTAIEQALSATGGNISQAAQELGISRVTLYRLIEKYRLELAALRREHVAWPRHATA